MKGGNYIWILVVFWAVLLIVSIVFNFLLSSTTVWYVDSDSELERFQKISGEKFERISCLAHEAKILKIHEIVEFGDVLDAENALGSCAARNV